MAGNPVFEPVFKAAYPWMFPTAPASRPRATAPTREQQQSAVADARAGGPGTTILQDYAMATAAGPTSALKSTLGE